jgi:cytochrome c1
VRAAAPTKNMAAKKSFMSSIYNRRAGTHDAINFGETKNAGVQLNKRNKNYGHKIQS